VALRPRLPRGVREGDDRGFWNRCEDTAPRIPAKPLFFSILRPQPSGRSCVHQEDGRAKPRAGPRNFPKKRTRRANVMGIFSKDIKTFDDLFLHTLQDIYYAENQITKALPTMIEKTTDPQLKQGFQTHLRETEGQIKRLEQVFQALNQSVKGVDCPAIDGIIEESDEVAGEIADSRVLDAALIAAAQAVEHYEITRYGTLVAWAKQLGHQNVVSLLQQNLSEEEATDKKLTAMAESKVNAKAA
jgi:ferritin-like metal-binding protein YciE